jgi:hypothetical protein
MKGPPHPKKPEFEDRNEQGVSQSREARKESHIPLIHRIERFPCVFFAALREKSGER